MRGIQYALALYQWGRLPLLDHPPLPDDDGPVFSIRVRRA
jgi:hypothetical protein